MTFSLLLLMVFLCSVAALRSTRWGRTPTASVVMLAFGAVVVAAFIFVVSRMH